MPRPGPRKPSLTVRLNPATLDGLKAAAESEEKSITDLVQAAVDDYLKKLARRKRS